MRLIDADKLPISFDGHTVSIWKNDIDNAPTVEAVPIDWLLNQLLEDNLLETHHTMCCLWERWKEENEKNSNTKND